jgi:hypothetical protein
VIDRFPAGRETPIVEGRSVTFLLRADADEVSLVQRVVGLPARLPLRRRAGTDLWYLVLDVAEGSRIEYQFEVRNGDHVERRNDPRNPKLAYSPFGATSVCFGPGYATRTGRSTIPPRRWASSPNWWWRARRWTATAS